MSFALASAPALAAANPTPRLGSARLEGEFALAGRVTVARNVRGEHVGENVGRNWTFVPLCHAGACRTIELIRHRAGATDRLALHRRGAGYYVGTGSFYAPLRCGNRTYRKGAAVPFTITVRVTAARASGATVVATRVTASYTNSSRTNLTPCVAILGHDAATYHGHLVVSTPPTGGTGAGGQLTDRSPAGS